MYLHLHHSSTVPFNVKSIMYGQETGPDSLHSFVEAVPIPLLLLFSHPEELCPVYVSTCNEILTTGARGNQENLELSLFGQKLVIGDVVGLGQSFNCQCDLQIPNV